MNSFFNVFYAFFAYPDLSGGQDLFFSGVGIGMVVVLLFVLIVVILRRRRFSRGISIRGETGNLYVTQTAIREFVAAVMEEFSEAALHGVSLCGDRHGYIMRIAIQVSPGAEVISLVEDIRRRIIRQVTDKMGLESQLKVNVTVRSFAVPQKRAPQKQSQRNMLTGFPNLAGVVSPGHDDY